MACFKCNDTGEIWVDTIDDEGMLDGADTIDCPDCKGTGNLITPASSQGIMGGGGPMSGGTS